MNYKNILKLLFLWLAIPVWSFAASPKGPALRFIYLQGYFSCSLSNHAPAQRFFEIAKSHPDARLYWGCFDGGFVDHAGDWTERFYLSSVSGDGQWSKPLAIHPRSAHQEILQILSKEIMALKANAPDLDPEEKLMDVFIAGHSHGGWMAMKTAYQVGLHPRIRLQQVLTIDPVSWELCNSAWMPLEVMKKANPFIWGGGDCHRAPRDLEPIAPFIASASEHPWVNIYETSMPFVSSGPIQSAPIDRRYFAQTHVDWITAHRAILLDPWTWFDFFQALTLTVDEHRAELP